MALALVLAACNPQASLQSAGSPSPSRPVPPATSPSGPLVSPSPTGSPMSVAASVDLGCAAKAPLQVSGIVLPAKAICVSSVRGNFDGASRDEAVVVYGMPGASEPVHPWYVRAILGSGRSLTADLHTLTGQAGLYQTAAEGVADPDGSGRDKAFIQLWCGASTCFVGMLAVDAGNLHFVRVASGPDRGKIVFAVGGSVMHQDRLECTSGTGGRRVTTRTFSSPDAGQHFTWRVLTYRMQGLNLSLTNQAQGTVTLLSDPHFAFSNVLDCPPLLLPPFGG